MAKETYRNVRKNKFTQVGNTLLWDKEVTLQAKGLLSIFLSNSEDWELNMKEIIKRSKNGRDAQYKIVDELIKLGYFARVEIRQGGKFIEMVYLFSDDKADVEEELEVFRDNPNAIINPNKKKKKTMKITPLPENQDTAKKASEPFPEIQDTDIPETVTPDTEYQYINNTSLNNTNGNNTNLNNTNIYQSIDSELNEIANVPMQVKKVISMNKKRLIDDHISVVEVISFYQSSDNTVNNMDFVYILSNVLTKTKKPIQSFNHVMKTAIKNHYDEYEGEPMPNVGDTYEDIRQDEY
jgi:hypothetical protein